MCLDSTHTLLAGEPGRVPLIPPNPVSEMSPTAPCKVIGLIRWWEGASLNSSEIKTCHPLNILASVTASCTFLHYISLKDTFPDLSEREKKKKQQQTQALGTEKKLKKLALFFQWDGACKAFHPLFVPQFGARLSR